MRIKSKYDPENFFHYSQSIPPSKHACDSEAEPTSWQHISYAFAGITAIAIAAFFTCPNIFGRLLASQQSVQQ